MPPQEESAVVTQTSSASASNYWDEPPEDKLEGKTLSTLNLSELEHQPNQGRNYWDEAKENIQKTLSKLSLSELVGTNKQTEQGEGETKTETIPRNVSSNSFWFWRNPSGVPLSDLQDVKKEGEEQQPGTVLARRPSGSGGYWWWNNPTTEKLTDGKSSDSQVDLQTLEKNARDSDRSQGQMGPISNLQHKLRSSWRASFARLSTNSLAKLDESKSSGGAVQQETNMEGKKKSSGIPKRDSFVVQEEESGITF